MQKEFFLYCKQNNIKNINFNKNRIDKFSIRKKKLLNFIITEIIYSVY